MSVTISTPLQICNNPLNRSKSKYLYSFPKTERFGKTKKPLCDHFYDIGTTTSKRKAGFGYGNKYDFTSGGMKTPAPNVYNIQSEID